MVQKAMHFSIIKSGQFRLQTLALYTENSKSIGLSVSANAELGTGPTVVTRWKISILFSHGWFFWCQVVDHKVHFSVIENRDHLVAVTG